MARPRLTEGQIERFQMVISTAEVEAIEKWRFNYGVASKSEAVRRLCQVGLAYERDGKVLLKRTERALKATLMAFDKINKADVDKTSPRILGGLAVVLEELLEANQAALSTLVAAGVFSNGLDRREFDELIKRAGDQLSMLKTSRPKK